MSNIEKQPWFYVAADYKSVHLGRKQRRNLWERSVFVFQAAPAEAERVALEVAKSNEHEYKNASGETVRWTFMGIDSIGELFDSTLQHGTEVYWDWFVKVDKPRSSKKPKPSPRGKAKRHPERKRKK